MPSSCLRSWEWRGTWAALQADGGKRRSQNLLGSHSTLRRWWKLWTPCPEKYTYTHTYKNAYGILGFFSWCPGITLKLSHCLGILGKPYNLCSFINEERNWGAALTRHLCVSESPRVQQSFVEHLLRQAGGCPAQWQRTQERRMQNSQHGPRPISGHPLSGAKMTSRLHQLLYTL